MVTINGSVVSVINSLELFIPGILRTQEPLELDTAWLKVRADSRTNMEGFITFMVLFFSIN